MPPGPCPQVRPLSAYQLSLRGQFVYAGRSADCEPMGQASPAGGGLPPSRGLAVYDGIATDQESNHRGGLVPALDPVALLAAYDAQLRGHVPDPMPVGWRVEWDGPVLRHYTEHGGFIGYRSVADLASDELDELIARQRDIFAARGEQVEWKWHSHGYPWGAKSPSELISGPARPATISRRSCSSSSSTPASGSSSTSPSHPSATVRLIRPSCWCCATRSASSPGEGCPLAPGRSPRPCRPGTPAAKARLVCAAGQAGYGASLAPRAGPKEVGELRRSSSPRSTHDQRRVPGADPPAGHGERGLGLSPPQGRAPQARLRGLGQHHSPGPASAPHPTCATSLSAHLEPLPCRPRRHDRRHRLLLRTPSS